MSEVCRRRVNNVPAFPEKCRDVIYEMFPSLLESFCHIEVKKILFVDEVTPEIESYVHSWLHFDA